MNAGTVKRIRGLAMRQESPALWTRASRQRSLPTKHGHAGSARLHRRVIRVYQSDSSSKRPASSALWGFRPTNRRDGGA